MILIRNLNKTQIKDPLCLTIGNFDGIHLGHQKILKQVINEAKKNNLKSGVLSFEPHPYFFFKKEKLKNFKIFNLSQKINFIRNLDIDYLIILHFNQEFAQISANNFIENILIKKLNTKKLVVGYDFAFGKNRSGDFQTLKNYSLKSDFLVEKIEPLLINNQICSSSLIRENILNGNFMNCTEFLGKNFFINSPVLSGKRIANKIGFPTANQIPKKNIIKPKYGVYKTKTYIPSLNKKFDSITNFGVKPTFNNHKKELFETHIFNFSNDIYDQKITVEFIDFIRDEKKFNNIDELKAQIKRDVQLFN